MEVGIDRCTLAKVTKDLNLGRIGEGTTEIMPLLDLWKFLIFDYIQADRQTDTQVIFRQRMSSIKCCYPSKVVFRQRSSSFKGRLLSYVVFRQRSFLPKVVFC